MAKEYLTQNDELSTWFLELHEQEVKTDGKGHVVNFVPLKAVAQAYREHDIYKCMKAEDKRTSPLTRHPVGPSPRGCRYLPRHTHNSISPPPPGVRWRQPGRHNRALTNIPMHYLLPLNKLQLQTIQNLSYQTSNSFEPTSLPPHPPPSGTLAGGLPLPTSPLTVAADLELYLGG